VSTEGGEGVASCVLDASALLALLNSEPGGEIVADLLASAVISSVNWSEVVQKSLDRQADVDGLRQDLEALGLEIRSFTAEDAERTAHLRAITERLGLSLGDRACLALAASLGLPAVTADRIWDDLEIGIAVRIAR
jgi:PIN domain nuclease of toxin-antitoxin system